MKLEPEWKLKTIYKNGKVEKWFKLCSYVLCIGYIPLVPQPCRYPSRIEKIDYDEGKMLVHFDRWSHRYDEWILWDSNRLRPLERPTLRKEGLKEEDDLTVCLFVK